MNPLISRSATEMDPEQAQKGNFRAPAQLDPFDLLITLARRKYFIVGFTVGCAAIAVVVSLLMPNRYTAITTFMPPQQTQSTASMLMSQLAGSGLGSLASIAGGSLGLKNPSDLYIGMLKSRTVEDAIIQKYLLLNLYKAKKLSDARKQLEMHGSASSGKDGLIAVSFEDKDPRRAADIANEYVLQLKNLTQHLAVTEAAQRRLFFEQQLQQARDELANAEVALRDTEQKTGTIQLDTQAKAVIQAIGNIRGQITAKEVQLQAMRSFATDQNPSVVVTQEQIAALKDQLMKLEKQQPTDSGPLLASSKLPAVGLEYIRRLREVKYRETLFEVLAKQFEAAKLDEARESAVIQVVDPAVEPDRKSSPQRSLIVLMAMLAAFVASSTYVLVEQAWGALQSDPFRAEQVSVLKQALSGRWSTKS